MGAVWVAHDLTSELRLGGTESFPTPIKFLYRTPREVRWTTVIKMLNTVRSIAFLGAMAMAAQVQPLVAQGQDEALRGPLEPHPAADEAIARLKSPYCPGLMLEVCTSYTGALLRDSIQAMAREGWTTDELVDWVVANHGEQYLAYQMCPGQDCWPGWCHLLPSSWGSSSSWALCDTCVGAPRRWKLRTPSCPKRKKTGCGRPSGTWIRQKSLSFSEHYKRAQH